MKKAKKFKFNLKKIVLTGLFIYALTTLIQQQFTLSELKSEKNEKQAQLAEIEAESQEIQNKIDNREDIKYIEKIARDELDMVRPNEIIYEDVDRVSSDKEQKKE
jgi:cell division protein DivIC